MWVFGYGSLVWRPAFDFEVAMNGFISGFARRFWQSSPDHRGTPEAPGRVVTLVADPGAQVWGRAYRIAQGDAEGVLAELDHREQAGYAHHRVTVHTADEHIHGVLVYVATAENPNFIGSAELELMAEHIARSRGPSGANAEYLFELAAALRGMGAEDPHVFALEARVSALLS